MAAELLKREDITDDDVVIKINREYKDSLSDEELYEVTVYTDWKTCTVSAKLMH